MGSRNPSESENRAERGGARRRTRRKGDRAPRGREERIRRRGRRPVGLVFKIQNKPGACAATGAAGPSNRPSRCARGSERMARKRSPSLEERQPSAGGATLVRRRAFYELVKRRVFFIYVRPRCSTGMKRGSVFPPFPRENRARAARAAFLSPRKFYNRSFRGEVSAARRGEGRLAARGMRPERYYGSKRPARE